MNNSEKEIKKVLFNHLDKNIFKVFLFWSRAKWDNKKKSDYDIWIIWKIKLDYKKYLNLKMDLDELPYLIDLVDFNTVDNTFKKIALKHIIKWN
jgi:predicted nucleotidyltransferase